jgi:hypothetical protein
MTCHFGAPFLALSFAELIFPNNAMAQMTSGRLGPRLRITSRDDPRLFYRCLNSGQAVKLSQSNDRLGLCGDVRSEKVPRLCA